MDETFLNKAIRVLLSQIITSEGIAFLRSMGRATVIFLTVSVSHFEIKGITMTIGSVNECYDFERKTNFERRGIKFTVQLGW